ncbi:spore coat protein CotJB [Paenibacillus beijingensis]|uniref:Protein CotJB domain-containing protein n=1 Tax=Paenibacillus beijingensis TaxID=1126833 RepID=A0A0D5NKR8_9BACL|nr:spore coat protein CotJB [Paenibacillus beijingensis]AJY75944.1 hypothetical protein VN24_17035 [Paenibacillus beijingensis]
MSAIEQWFQYSYMTGLSELHEIDFALTELRIYLNRTPEDDMAIRQLKQLTEKREQIASKLASDCKSLQQAAVNEADVPPDSRI